MLCHILDGAYVSESKNLPIIIQPQKFAVLNLGSQHLPFSGAVNATNVAPDIISVESLRQQVKSLKTQVEKYATEKSMLEKTLQEQKNESIKHIDKLKREVVDLKDDAEVLKNILKRLNEELNR